MPILKAVKKILLPIVSLCVRRSIKFYDVVELTKSLFVQAAKEEIERTGDTASASKIAAISGVHRKDVARLSNEDPPQPRPKNIIARVMNSWNTDKSYTTAKGKPRALRVEGRNSEFAQLVESVNGGDLSAYTILYEMERLKAVRIKAGKVSLLWQDFAPPPGVEEGLSLLAQDTADLVAAVEENTFDRKEVPNLHLRTMFDNVVEEAVPAIRSWILTEGSAFQKRVREFIAQFDRDVSPKLAGKPGGVRVVVGAFGRIGASCLEKNLTENIKKVHTDE